MKKRNVFFLLIISILTLCAITGLLVYAFILQEQNDRNRFTSKNGQEQLSPTITPSEAVSPTPTVTPTKALSKVVLGFAGDVNLDVYNPPIAKYNSVGKDITRCFSKDLLKEMRSADIMMLNNEFSYSTRGTKAQDKQYTFRAKPDNINILKEMGVDIVSLANNHALDYGPEALQDTFDTLDNAGIDYVGAGKNLDRAKAPVYYSVGGRKIAFLAASRVMPAGNWYATDSQSGMVGTYDPTIIVESIKEAKANCDFVVIFVHWGKERNTHPEEYQRNLAKQYIDAGADAVIGCHPHVMQGMEYYKGKPIAYSLGNYWFNDSLKQSGMIKLYLNTDGSVKFQLLPVMNKNTETYLLTDKYEKKNYYNTMRDLSFGVTIDEDGFIH
jgi:Putative enzyme of poly-gamma-glutamate biosynthesis (capsule formation)